MGVGLQDQHFNFKGQPRLADPCQADLEPGMGSGHSGDRVIGGRREPINCGFDPTGLELREFANKGVVDPCGVGHEGHEKATLPSVSIKLGPMRMECKFAPGHQKKKNALFGQGIEQVQGGREG